MHVEFIEEFKLDQYTKKQIGVLLSSAFPEENFDGRHYFKQLPHYRLLLKKDNKVIGQLGLDFRVMTLDNQPINVLGIIDFAILPQLQNQGFGATLIEYLINEVDNFRENIDFLFLVTEKPVFYERFGFKPTKQFVRWLITEEHINYGIKEDFIESSLMYKQIGIKKWVDNTTLDLMGYWY